LALSYCYWNIGEFDKAMGLFTYAKRLAPSVDFIKKNEVIYKEALDRKNYIDNLLGVLTFTKENGCDPEALAKSIPPSMFENQTVVMIKNRFTEPTRWSKKSVVMYCGETPNTWSPDSTKDGVGGSEEAVINMADE
jgi:hypothetical protein